MRLPRRTFLHLAAGAAALPALSRSARAQAYPTRPARLIIPYAPGSAPDIVARLIGQWLSERLGQQFVIENRSGLMLAARITFPHFSVSSARSAQENARGDRRQAQQGGQRGPRRSFRGRCA